MTDQTDNVTELPTKRSLKDRINKQRVAKVAAITGGAALAIVYLKRKFNGECEVDGTVHVETADQPES